MKKSRSVSKSLRSLATSHLVTVTGGTEVKSPRDPHSGIISPRDPASIKSPLDPKTGV